MVVQAGGARRILDRDPDARASRRRADRAHRPRGAGGDAPPARRPARATSEPSALAPQPSCAELGALVARAREAGLPVELHVDGERRPLPAGLDLAAFRVVQEGLTNALKYAGRAPDRRARALATPASWSSRSSTAGPAAPRERRRRGGHGLVGMRERVRLYGGELEAGPARRRRLRAPCAAAARGRATEMARGMTRSAC